MKWDEKMIREEIKRLDRMTGLKGHELPIVFTRSTHCLGSFRAVKDRPVEFGFSREFFEADDFSMRSAYDVIRHEYAHFMNFMLNGDDRGQPHGAQWKECARAVGAHPEAYYRISRNEIYLKEEKKIKEEADKMKAFMDALHPGECLMHPAFGKGIICLLESEGSNARVEIEFSCGKKKLSAKWLAQNCRLCRGAA